MEVINIADMELKEEIVRSIELKEEDTYDIEVEDAHHYILSNGIVSHNTSILAGIVSGGIEPVFLKEYTRWSIVTDNDKRKLLKKGVEFPDTTKTEWFETKVFKFIKKGGEQILKGTFDGVNYEIDTNRGLTKGTEVVDYGWKWRLDNLTEKEHNSTPIDRFATTEELGVNAHIDVLKVVSHYTDMNSSKTVNLASEYPYKDFKDLYMDG